MITKWNRGIRIKIVDLIPHGDNASSFHTGTCVFTKGTDDKESKQGYFYHRYVNSNDAVCCGYNGNANEVAVFVMRY